MSVPVDLRCGQLPGGGRSCIEFAVPIGGQRYRAGKINVHIEGDNPHTRHNTLLVRTDIHPGDIIDIRKIRNSERRFKASGLFQTDPSKGSAPKIVLSPPDADAAEKALVRPLQSTQRVAHC